MLRSTSLSTWVRSHRALLRRWAGVEMSLMTKDRSCSFTPQQIIIYN